jgi:hypothetical protein
MNITTTQEEITFHHTMYDVVVPNNVNIEYNFNSLVNETMGVPLALEIDSMNKKVIPKYGILGGINYFLSVVIESLNLYSHTPSSKIIQSSATVIYGTEKINSLFVELKKFNYFKIDEQINGLKVVAEQQVKNILIPGTEKHRKDKKWLFFIVFLVFFVPIIFGITMDKNTTSADLIQFSILSLFILSMCYLGYKMLTRNKEIK